MRNLEHWETFPMESTFNESNALSPPRRCSGVFESLWVRKDVNFRLNLSLLGDHQRHEGDPNGLISVGDKQRCPISSTSDQLKKKFGIKAILEGQNSESSIQELSPRKNEKWHFIPGSALTFEQLTSKHVESHGSYRARFSVPVSVQEHEPESSNKGDGTSGKQWVSRYVSNLMKSRQSESSNSGSTRMKSNAPSNTDSRDTDFPEKRWFDRRPSFPTSSSEEERSKRKRKQTKRSKESGQRPSKTPKPKVHQCDFCPKSFVLRSACETHHRIHTGERPFQCPSCGMTFTSNRSLKKHTEIHQPVLLKMCKTCGKGFRTNESLRNHTKVHREWSGPHSCGGCGRQFAKKVFLDRHLPNCTDH